MAAALIFCVFLTTTYSVICATSVPLLFGRRAEGTRLHMIHHVSVRQCVLECKTREACAAFSYFRQAKKCSLRRTFTGAIKSKGSKSEVMAMRTDILNGNSQCGSSVCNDTSVCDIQSNSCVVRECRFPNLPNGVVHGNMQSVGSKVVFTCTGYYTLDSPINQSECQADGSWNHEPTCVLDCGEPMVITGADVSSGGSQLDDVRVYTCRTGYNATECPPPSSLTNGNVDSGYRVQGATRKYSCNSGYVGSGDPYITCQSSATWTTLALTCSANCGSPPNVANAQVSNGGELEGDVRTYTCNTGYGVTAGTSTNVTCRSNGDWSTAGFTCIHESCAAGWQQIGSSCYLVGNNVSCEFMSAQTYCGRISGYVVELETLSENNNLKTWIKKNYGPISWWIGLSDSASEGTHRWIRSGQKLSYSGWQPEEPENKGCDDSVVMWANLGWADVPGSGPSNRFVPVCERSTEIVS